MSKRRDKRNKLRKRKHWYDYDPIVPTRKIQAEFQKMENALKPSGEVRHMLASNDFFKDVPSVWIEKIPKFWVCQRADKPLCWMIGKSEGLVKNELIKMGFKLHWI